MSNSIEVEVENYEVIQHKKDTLITYSLSDCEKFQNIEAVNITAKETNSGYDLHISDLDGNKLAIFKNIDFDSFEKTNGKRILLAGISEITNEISEVAAAKNIDIIHKNKFKMGGM